MKAWSPNHPPRALHPCFLLSLPRLYESFILITNVKSFKYPGVPPVGRTTGRLCRNERLKILVLKDKNQLL